jgi:uridine kinase
MVGHVHGLRELDRLILQGLEHADPAILVAVDGRSGVGKSTLAIQLADRYGGGSILADDFYPGGSDLHWMNLSPAKRADRVIDWQRLRAEVLEPLLSGHRATWRPFDFQAGKGLAPQTLTQHPVPIIILDGAYSSRPELSDIIDVSVLLVLDDTERRARLLAREGHEFMTRWHRIWDDAEDYYFSMIRPPEAFDIVLRHR